MGKRGKAYKDSYERVDTAVIGAGASGCMAAVSAALKGARVLLLEANDKICRKIYATGNGRCNLTNLYMSRECYHTGGGEDLSAFFARFSVEDHMAFWQSRGICLHDRQGYVYPQTDQAATIAEGFEKILDRLGVRIALNERVQSVLKVERVKDESVKDEKGIFQIKTQEGHQYFAETVVLAGGGMAGPQFGCRGDMYKIAEALGHRVRKPLPALTPLISDDRDLKAAAGVRCDAAVTLRIGGREHCTERGELQMTEAGISGIPVFQMSAAAACALDEEKEVSAVIDFLPAMDECSFQAEIARRMGEDRDYMLGRFFLGLVNKKVLDLILRRRGMQAEKKASKVSDNELTAILHDMRRFTVHITAAGGFQKAQVTTGGVPLSQTDENLQSERCPGLYLAGELLDVDGICGGYNLQWAMTSGWIAGMSAAEQCIRNRKGSYK